MSLQQTVPPPDNELTQEEMIYISDHLAACAEYLEHLDVLWLGDDSDGSEPDLLLSAEISTPPIPPNIAEKLQHTVNNRIQRGDLAANALKLGTEGMMQVLLALIRPVLGGSNSQSKD